MAILDLGKFDPSLVSGGTIQNLLPGAVGTLIVINDSSVTIKLRWGNRTKRFIAGTIDVVKICAAMPSIDWMQDIILGNASQAPVSVVQIDGYTQDEELPYTTYPIAIPRTSNIGNSIPVSTSVSSVSNDGNTAPTSVVEATPSGAGSSQLKLNNDGSAILGGGLVALSSAGIFTALPANSVPAAAINGSVANATNATTLNGPIATYANSAFHIDAIGTETPAGNARAILFQTWDGSASHNLLSIGSSFAATVAINDSGLITAPNFHPTQNGGSGVLNGINTYSGTGPGTITHAATRAPQYVGVTENVLNSTTTVGVDSLGSTTFHLNIAGGTAWLAIAAWL